MAVEIKSLRQSKQNLVHQVSVLKQQKSVLKSEMKQQRSKLRGENRILKKQLHRAREQVATLREQNKQLMSVLLQFLTKSEIEANHKRKALLKQFNGRMKQLNTKDLDDMTYK